MPTNNIKHRMLTDARKIAGKKYFGYLLVTNTNDGQEFTDISAEQEKQEEIQEILKSHPEYDEDLFRDMIRTATKRGIKNASKFDD